MLIFILTLLDLWEICFDQSLSPLLVGSLLSPNISDLVVLKATFLF